MQFRTLIIALKFPRQDHGMVLVVTKCFSIGCLMFLAEMCSGRFVTLQRVNAHQLGEFEEIRNAPRALERLVVVFFVSWHTNVAPEFCAQFGDFSERLAQSLFVT